MLCLILVVGLSFTVKSKFFQLKSLYHIRKNVKELLNLDGKEKCGVSPIRLYFASMGGIIGIGNMSLICAIIAKGGPGTVVWFWIALLLGMLIKYAEIFLSIKYRVKKDGMLQGGPMYYMEKVSKCDHLNKILITIFCVATVVYGVEIYQFSVIVDTISDTLKLDKIYVLVPFLSLCIISAVGGVSRLANICTAIMPLFFLVYIAVSFWIMFENRGEMSNVFHLIGSSAFGADPALGIGGGLLLTLQHGLFGVIYCGDIGIGYDGMVHSETSNKHPHKQAKVGIFDLFTNGVICTITAMVILSSGIWKTGISDTLYLQEVLIQYLPHASYFIAAIYFITGFTTVVGFLVVGNKGFRHLFPDSNKYLFFVIATIEFVACSFLSRDQVLSVMELSGALLVMSNVASIYMLRKEVEYK